MKWLSISLLCLVSAQAQPKRTLVDAHNCYPDNGQWGDRLERALGMRIPIAIEQDLAWDAARKGSFLSHEKIVLGRPPGLRYFFFERVRPVIENALESGKSKDQWPLITLNIDFKTLEPEHLQEVYALLDEYKDWLTTAPKSDKPEPLEIKPLLVLVGDSDEAEAVFNGKVPRLLAFGAAKLNKPLATTPVKTMLSAKATNYRRWVNIPWPVVENGGQKAAAAWLPAENARLVELTKQAHELGYLARVYTLNGHDAKENRGWTTSYNFGSLEAAKTRWEACQKAGVDYIASDQYEALWLFLKTPQLPR